VAGALPPPLAGEPAGKLSKPPKSAKSLKALA
jgi:hypothetical protein